MWPIATRRVQNKQPWHLKAMANNVSKRLRILYTNHMDIFLWITFTDSYGLMQKLFWGGFLAQSYSHFRIWDQFIYAYLYLLLVHGYNNRTKIKDFLNIPVQSRKPWQMCLLRYSFGGCNSKVHYHSQRPLLSSRDQRRSTILSYDFWISILSFPYMDRRRFLFIKRVRGDVYQMKH